MLVPTTDFSIFDGQEVVSYEPAGGPVVDDIRAVRRPLTHSRQRNVERYVQLLATDVIFHLDATLLVAAQLAAGDSLTDADDVLHTVMFVERQSLNNTVAVVCRRAS
jgi:hypothetical protein